MKRPLSMDLRLRPEELASRLADLPGFAFLDSSADAEDSISLIAAFPEAVVDGVLSDPGELREKLRTAAEKAPASTLSGGGALGWIGFDGRFRFGIYPEFLVYSHRTGEWASFGNHSGRLLSSLPELPSRRIPTVDFRPSLPASTYREMVRRAQEYIASGDIYQACLAHRFSSAFEGDPWPLYAALRRDSPAPYSAYLALGGATVLSSSPECFLRMDGRFVETRPIKGTRPRRARSAEDERSARELVSSPKEAAELVMITDLERNDLGSVCEYGSVHVSDLLRLESYRQVFHLVSTVRGTLRPDVSHLEALAACFPGGSISGAPKKRALEIIAELEPEPRGIFTGAIGYFGFNGESQFSIAIRTVVVEGAEASFHVGAGIVADSVPGEEWQETLDKAAGILLAASRTRANEPFRPDPIGIRKD